MDLFPHELIGYTLFRRKLTQVIAQLQSRERLIVTKHGEPAFVVMTIKEYEKLKG
jgi:prevent-host-death family protein